MTARVETLHLESRPGTFADLLWPARGVVRSAGLAFAGSLLLAALARVAIPMPGTMVPFTLQTLGVVLVGALLGSRLGAAACGLYLVEGALGLPVFAGGAFGIAWIAGPTGGYLLAFAPAAFLAGSLAERGWDRTPRRAALAFSLAMLLILVCGALWLARFHGFQAAFALGFAPFVVEAAVKSLVAAGLLPAGWRLLGARRPIEPSL